MDIKEMFAEQLKKTLEDILTKEQILAHIEIPTYETQGDIAFPCYVLAKYYRKSPEKIAEEVVTSITHPLFKDIKADGAYVNVFLNKGKISQAMMEEILTKKEEYGNNAKGKGKTMVIDFSSPNIAKPFSMGHLRSTVIGNALSNIAEKSGYKVVKINHLGDWGTQFGKLIIAYNMWGEKEKVKQQPIKELFHLYVKFHEEAETNPELEEMARVQFKELEDGDEEADELWNWFREESLQEFKKLYDLLGVTFDVYQGEAFYNDKMDKTIEDLKEKDLLTKSDGAQVVPLDNLPSCLIQKSDGATLYTTREITAALYRKETYRFDRALYVVGQEQRIHFQQIFTVLKKMGYQWANEMEHIPFGFILKDGKKMSTRKGKVVLLEEVLQDAIGLAENNIEEKNPTLRNKEEVAQVVGVGAIIFQDLKHDRNSNVEFNLEEMLKFEGFTGPYIQYTHARACTILRKGEPVVVEKVYGLSDEYSFPVIKKLMDFPDVMKRALKDHEASHIARLLFEIAQGFNKYYSQVKILQDDPGQNDRLAFVQIVTIVLKEGLCLLGIKAPEAM